MRCPDTAALPLSPPLVARPLSRAWPFAVARATRVCRRNHNQTGTVWRVIALARSDHPIATGESEPSMTVPRTSPPAIVWCCETPVLENLDERSERDKRELGQGPTWSIQHQRAHQSRVRTLAAGPRSAWGRTMPDRESVVWSRIVTIRHATSFFGDFGGPFPSQDGPPEKKFHLESGLNQRDKAIRAVPPTQVPAFPN